MYIEKIEQVLDQKVSLLTDTIKRTHKVIRNVDQLNLENDLEIIVKNQKEIKRLDLLFLASFDQLLNTNNVKHLKDLPIEIQKSFKRAQKMITDIQDLEFILSELRPKYEPLELKYSSQKNLSVKLKQAAKAYTNPKNFRVD